MSIIDNITVMDSKIPEITSAKTETSEFSLTPKINSSASFNVLAKVKGKPQAKSPIRYERSQDYSEITNPSSQQIPTKYKTSSNVRECILVI